MIMNVNSPDEFLVLVC